MKTYIYSCYWLRKTIGIVLIVFGVLGLILPILPGVILLIIGIELVGVRVTVFDRILSRDVPTPK